MRHLTSLLAFQFLSDYVDVLCVTFNYTVLKISLKLSSSITLTILLINCLFWVLFKLYEANEHYDEFMIFRLW